MSIQLYPLEFYVSFNGGFPQPRDPLLFEAVQKYCKAEFGEEKFFNNDLKTWVLAEHNDSGYVVTGIASIRTMLDCYTFHITPRMRDGQNREGAKTALREAEAGRNLLLQRAAAYLQDQFGVNTRVQVYVSPAAERYWKRFLRLIRATPANRWEVQV